jgi:hypothetical protein
VTVGDWIVAFVAVCALALSAYNTYIQRRDRTPRVEMVVKWNLPSDLPEAFKPALGRLHTANPGEMSLLCEITNVGMVGVRLGRCTCTFMHRLGGLNRCTFRKGNK